MRTTFKEEDNDYVMYFEGRLDTAVAAKVEKEMQPLSDCSGHDIVLDCSKLEYISSATVSRSIEEGKSLGQPRLHQRAERRYPFGLQDDRLHQPV